MSKLLILNTADNVLVALGPIEPGRHVLSDGSDIYVLAPVTLGHKIARRNIPKGEPILKYGVPIGEAITAIRAGDHVHVHNIQSRYTPTHLLTETAGGSDA